MAPPPQVPDVAVEALEKRIALLEARVRDLEKAPKVSAPPTKRVRAYVPD